MKFEAGQGLDIYGTVETNADETQLIYEGPEVEVVQNIVENMNAWLYGEENRGKLPKQLDAFLLDLCTRFRGQTWVRVYGDRPEDGSPLPLPRRKVWTNVQAETHQERSHAVTYRKIEVGFCDQVYGTIETSPDGATLIYQGSGNGVAAMKGFVEFYQDLYSHRGGEGYDLSQFQENNLAAFLLYMTSRLRGYTWACVSPQGTDESASEEQNHPMTEKRPKKRTDAKKRDNGQPRQAQTTELDPNDALAYNRRGDVYADLGKSAQAIADYTKAIALLPTYGEAYYNRGVEYDRLKQYETALADYTRAIEYDPNDPRIYNNRGNIYSSLQQFELAIADYTHALELDPHHMYAYNGRGNAYYDLKHYALALIDYARAIELDPGYAMAYNGRGNTSLCLQRVEEAEADYTRAIELDTEYATAYYNRGRLYYERQCYEQAVADNTRAIEIKPTYAYAYNGRAMAYQELKHYDQALADCNRAIELDPTGAYAYDSRGTVYRCLQQYEEALADYQTALELDPNDAIVYDNRGQLYEMLQQYQQAIEEYERAVALDPTNQVYQSRKEAARRLFDGA